MLEAQAEKQGTYKHLGDKAYGELKSGDVEGQKGLALGLKKEIEKRAPEVGPMNQRASDLYDLRPSLINSTGREENRNLIGLRLPVIDSPELKSMAAIGLNRIGSNPVAQAVGKVATPSTSLPLAGRVLLNSDDLKKQWGRQ